MFLHVKLLDDQLRLQCAMPLGRPASVECAVAGTGGNLRLHAEGVSSASGEDQGVDFIMHVVRFVERELDGVACRRIDCLRL